MALNAVALLASAEAVEVVKRPIPVDVIFADTDGRCETLEGPVGYRAGDAILTGVKGERWPVARARFLDSYRPCNSLPAGAAGPYLKLPAPARAVRLTGPIRVPAGDQGDLIEGHAGDWLLGYADGTYGVLADDIFTLSYDRRSRA